MKKQKQKKCKPKKAKEHPFFASEDWSQIILCYNS